jgi:ATP-dependent Zn protease
MLQVTAATQDAADREMAKLLAEAYDDVMATLQRNRAALDKTISVLLEQTTMSGQQVCMDITCIWKSV